MNKSKVARFLLAHDVVSYVHCTTDTDALPFGPESKCSIQLTSMNSSGIIIIIIIIIILMSMFMALSSWNCHCENSHSSFDKM